MKANGRAAHLPAVLLSLSLNLPLLWAGRFGYYDNDYNHLLTFLSGHQSLEHSWRNILRYVLSDEPLFNVYHGLRYYLLGGDPWPHHLLQGILVAANAMLAYSLVWRLSKNTWLSYLFLFLFLSYPNRGEAYYWAAAVYPLMLLWLLAAAHFCLSWLRAGRRRTFAAFWLCYSLAVFTHEAAFGFIGVFGVLWALERRGALSWREGVRFLAPLAVTNAAYLVVRQARWFGIGGPDLSFSRPLEPGRFFENLIYSLDVNFGEHFLRNTRELAREATSLYGLGPIWDGILSPRLARGAVALVAAAGAIQAGLSPRRVDAGMLKLGTFAGAWFFFGYAPTYFLYIAGRHGYLPSPGACLLIAVALWLPAAAGSGGRSQRLLEAAALGVGAYACMCGYAACLGEGARWAEASRFTAKLKSQMLEARPSLPRDTRLVILDIPMVWKGIPLLPPYAMDAAVRVWYHNPEILTHPDFYPRKRDFLFHPGDPEHPQPYDYLLLFSYTNEVLTQRKYLIFEDGARVRVGAALGEGADAGEAAPLSVVTGRRVQ